MSAQTSIVAANFDRRQIGFIAYQLLGPIWMELDRVG
jgi:hypothetical protein